MAHAAVLVIAIIAGIYCAIGLWYTWDFVLGFWALLRPETVRDFFIILAFNLMFALGIMIVWPRMMIDDISGRWLSH